MKKRPFFIDCDTGTDDAIAITAALYAEEIEILGMAAVSGNAAVRHTLANTLNLTRYLGFHMPVARGAWRPLKLHRQVSYAEGTHGETGLGSLVLPDTEEKPALENAVDLLWEKACEAQGELEVLATGPLTNVACALLFYPELKQLIRHIWIMGGAIRGGNITPSAEFNIWCDPEAADILLASGIPCTWTGLDVTEKAVLTSEDIEFMKGLHTKAGDVTAALLEFMAERHRKGGEDILMHDALALAAALCPACLTMRPCHIQVECQGACTWGHTAVDLKGRTGRKPNAEMAVEIDTEEFRKWLRDTIGKSRTYCIPAPGALS